MKIKKTRFAASTHGPWVWCAVFLFSVSGCATPWEKSALLQDSTPNIDRIQGPQERAIRNVFKKKQEEASRDEMSLTGKSLKPIKGNDEYLDALELYKAEKYKQAEVAFKKVAKKYKKSEIREDALFSEAESAWKQDHYARAHDVYAVLLKEYPSTRHLTVVTERMFKLGRLWLDFPEVAKLSEIQQVNFDDPHNRLPPEEAPQLPKSKPIFVMNLSNKKEPLFDTAGNGCAALQSVWMNDPTGPLADDAMMLVASYHARKGNYIEADRFYRMLRETFPSSPHIQNAYLLGGHVKLMSYQGPEYENRTLDEAKSLKEGLLRLYPNVEERGRIQDELARIEEAKAYDAFTRIDYYIRKGNKRAAAVICFEVMDNFPKSQFSEKAKAKLIELGPQYASGAVLLTPQDDKNVFILDRIFPENPSFLPKKKTKTASSRNASKSKNDSSTSSSGSISNPESGKNKRDANEEYDDSSEDSSTDEIPKPKAGSGSGTKRGLDWFNFGRKPARLPDDDDSDDSDAAKGGQEMILGYSIARQQSLFVLCGLLFVGSTVGCGYTIGDNFPRDIKTVAVPIFENKTNRRGIEFQLTEAVQNEITKRSHFRLAKGLDADSRLTGEIVSIRKDVLGENKFDDPRELQVTLMVKVRWEDLRSGKLLAESETPMTPDAVPLSAQSEFAPETGGSLATAMDTAMQSMARKIVNLMETPW